MTSKPYDHDEDWRRREAQGSVLWGSQSAHVYRAVLTLLRRFAPPPGLVVDMGSGAGAFGVGVNAAGYAYLGLEDSAAAVRLGSGRHGHEGLVLLQVDLAASLPVDLAPTEVCAVTSINVLHCLVDDVHRREFLANARRLAGKDVPLLLTTMAGPPLSTLRPSTRPRRFKAPQAILAEVRAAGFADIIHHEVEGAESGANVPNLTLVAR